MCVCVCMSVCPHVCVCPSVGVLQCACMSVCVCDVCVYLCVHVRRGGLMRE